MKSETFLKIHRLLGLDIAWFIQSVEEKMTGKKREIPNLLPLFIENSLTDDMRESDLIYKGFLHPCPQCMNYDFVRGGCEELSCYILDAMKERK